MTYLLQHLLKQAARKSPQKEVIIAGETKLTYKQLDKLSNRFANLLIATGVKKGDRVGLYMPKNIPAVIGVFGILKAGAAYVPLDINAPSARIAFFIQNCEMTHLMVSSSKKEIMDEVFKENTSLDTVILSDDFTDIPSEWPAHIHDWNKVMQSHDKNPNVRNIDTDLAYILYTSGSTGVPKGVMTSHHNSLAFINSMSELFKILPEDKVANPAPLKFGISIFDIFVTIKEGATMVIIPDLLTTFPCQLADWMHENEISIWFSVPFVLSRLVLDGQIDRYNFDHLRAVFFAGEVFPAKYLRQLMNLWPSVTYFNIYGTTETNVITGYEVEPLDEDHIKPIPIGKAISNLEAFLIDERGNLIDRPGESGELCVRGAAVAQGYWANEAKTKENFIENPLDPHSKDLVYKTGDVVVLDEKGRFHYTGRRDHMIKSRGYRIEIGEIEAALYSHKSIKEAAVVGIPDELAGHKIKAFVTLHDKRSLEPVELQKFCTQQIPRYMVPESIEFLEALPKTSTGKIDKTALT
ncbi:amino acid adenylation domain-containing protein [Fulvivirgaceae bacterium BMA10]|uniref:Amino acid adenylation domain-containing protein n=1 Tax=Splendidivirga corallicola TaxID=3051826 RepID=A0ABT8KQ25_9BACT|nr:amino acid adenylation domain-containing protein [Fulvivirgaceae bacterium BMA10]